MILILESNLDEMPHYERRYNKSVLADHTASRLTDATRDEMPTSLVSSSNIDVGITSCRFRKETFGMTNMWRYGCGYFNLK